MKCVKISKSHGYIEYDDDNIYWNANVLFKNDEIIIEDSSRTLTDHERNNIITEILNVYAFGCCLITEDNIWNCKLKNRNNEKQQELKKSGKSYSIIWEEVLQLDKNEDDNDIVTAMRGLYRNLRIMVKEYKDKYDKTNIRSRQTLTFEFNGSKEEYNLFIKIVRTIKDEIEDALSNYINDHITIIGIEKGKYKFSKDKSDKNALITVILE